MTPVRNSPTADDDVLEIITFLLDRSVNAARRFFDDFDALIRLLSEHPGAGRPRAELGDGNVRSILLNDHWVVLYVETANLVEIRRIVNARRDLRSLRLRD